MPLGEGTHQDNIFYAEPLTLTANLMWRSWCDSGKASNSSWLKTAVRCLVFFH
jgi:hypothetical protein